MEKNLTRIEEEMFKDLIRHFDISSIFFIGDNIILLMCCGEGFKFIKGSEKGKRGNNSNILKIAEKHLIGLEEWIYSFVGKKGVEVDKKTIYLGG